ncbi:uncharacterized protein C8R40DRAFT_1175921 [Lentinula edodes]|uniref:uncharacterized protein n=1 Tax=Lentinula edodes TaxID=5353 RepID=UPI001E8EDA9F|nr:uncharacterized protein C8R40DRAFT_1175921 [Lentinula edodes]KAH7870230.1 hypothetical protein C8R40DRAFT_1175921 [Lentinula edodes]
MCTPQAPSLCKVALEVQAHIISYLHDDSLALCSLGIGNKSLGQMVFPKLYASVPTMALRTLSKSETDTQKILGIQHPSYYVEQLRVSTSGPRRNVVRDYFTPSLFNINTHRDSMKLFSYTSHTLALSDVLGFWIPNSLSIEHVVLKCPTRNIDKLQLQWLSSHETRSFVAEWTSTGLRNSVLVGTHFLHSITRLASISVLVFDFPSYLSYPDGIEDFSEIEDLEFPNLVHFGFGSYSLPLSNQNMLLQAGIDPTIPLLPGNILRFLHRHPSIKSLSYDLGLLTAEDLTAIKEHTLLPNLQELYASVVGCYDVFTKFNLPLSVLNLTKVKGELPLFHILCQGLKNIRSVEILTLGADSEFAASEIGSLSFLSMVTSIRRFYLSLAVSPPSVCILSLLLVMAFILTWEFSPQVFTLAHARTFYKTVLAWFPLLEHLCVHITCTPSLEDADWHRSAIKYGLRHRPGNVAYPPISIVVQLVLPDSHREILHVLG